ncbi:hypothetical protein [Nocardioides sp. CFH 31398]|uniref:hypothetical protein n=1 Tax=Nocardioides sp. CFH 31398 TaxID=2919579 RepID=UPI001F05CA78|nr:hypothetical protein [Nocardioides sp. CFH 31398]MCH1867993.1 hypothetical protein [Nocardioides sp. CFH 31398]
MSKESALRAMREAKYAERLAKGSTGIPATRFGQSAPAARPAGSKTRPPVAPPLAAADTTADKSAGAGTDADELCGHKSMNGRTCTREKGHSAKNHRYS